MIAEVDEPKNEPKHEPKHEPEITVTAAEPTVKSNSLIVVSNRLPFVLKIDENGKMYRQAR